MRGARGLLLLAIVVILSWLGFAYRIQRKALERQTLTKPNLLPSNLNGTSLDWNHVEYDAKDGRKISEIWARKVKQEQDSSRVELEQVRVHQFHKEGSLYDLFESPAATFQPGDQKLYADGPVSITLAVPMEGEPTHRLVSIKTSGVTLEKETAKASTDRPADFVFENGTGKCVGASYDPQTKELHMNSNVELNLQSRSPNGKPMKLESGQLLYKELDSQIFLTPWARLTRDTSVLEGADTVVTLNRGIIQLVQTQKAKGTDLDPKRRLDYGAEQLTVHYTEHGVVESVDGESNARMVSSTDTSRTTITADRIDLAFDVKDHESTLRRALATKHAQVESKPLSAAPGQALADTRLMRSEEIELKMNPGGREISEVHTPVPGHIEFLPNHDGSRRRQIDGEKIDIAYGPRNIIQSFHSVNVETKTDPAKPNGAPSQTWSKNMQAEFDPAGQMTRIRQWDNFRYAEGDRKAVASQATLEQSTNVINLETASRVWDPTGSTSGDKIRLDQTSGGFTAEGHVSSSRLPDQQSSNSSGLLTGGDPIQATAQRMTSANNNMLIRYEGKADMWQGGSRIRADRIEIDRQAKRLVANGAVQTQLLEKAKEGTGAKPSAPSVFTNVKSTSLIYTDSDRLAYYTGGVVLTRPEILVKSLELRSYLSEAGSDSSLDHAIADGKVEILQTAAGRTRNGASEHAEYNVADQRIKLDGGNPTFTDSLKGNTAGKELTYSMVDDSLKVTGVPEQPAKSRIRRK